MKLDLEKTRQTVERALHAAREGERGGVRVHCRAAEKLLKGVKTPPAPEVLKRVHHASTAIETSLAVQDLEQALDLLGTGAQT
jgi:hypothetical protein